MNKSGWIVRRCRIGPPWPGIPSSRGKSAAQTVIKCQTRKSRDEKKRIRILWGRVWCLFVKGEKKTIWVTHASRPNTLTIDVWIKPYGIKDMRKCWSSNAKRFLECVKRHSSTMCSLNGTPSPKRSLTRKVTQNDRNKKVDVVGHNGQHQKVLQADMNSS